MQVAVLADPHFHDTKRHPVGQEFGESAFRTFADTAHSTRVFNESDAAFRAALDDIVRRGIRNVVIVGDLTDDGQAATVRNTMEMLRPYQEQHSIRFFATPGNHDLYATHGRNQSKRFLNPDGTHTLVTSDSSRSRGRSTARLVTPEMYCAGYASGLEPMRSLGYFRSPEDLHWECPFGLEDALDKRTFEISSPDGSITRTMIDASYLCEPVSGLWILSIDANVFEPRDGGFDERAETSYVDSTGAGWNAMLRHKRFILDWIADVTTRAARQGNNLIAFSHYPMINPMEGTLEDERYVFGHTSFVKRAPNPEVAASAIRAGLKVHFSGHLHVNDTKVVRTQDGFLYNIAVPTMVAFPPGYKIVEFQNGEMHIETVRLGPFVGFDGAFEFYRHEAQREGRDASFLDSLEDHAEFLSEHVRQMVITRYLPGEWPEELADLVRTRTLADLAETVAHIRDAPQTLAGFDGISFLDMVADWYRVRQGRELAHPFIGADRLTAYKSLAQIYAVGSWPEDAIEAKIAAFMRMFMVYADCLPSANFRIDLTDGAIAAR